MIKYVKSLDRYGNPVQMTYNGRKTFISFSGGVATIITFILIFYWWIITFLNHSLNPYRRYTTIQFEFSHEPDPETNSLPTYDINPR